MSKTDKLKDKLNRLNISAAELRTLLKKMGWIMTGKTGSHEQWFLAGKDYPDCALTLSAHGKDLKTYQMKEARKKILGEE